MATSVLTGQRAESRHLEQSHMVAPSGGRLLFTHRNRQEWGAEGPLLIPTILSVTQGPEVCPLRPTASVTSLTRPICLPDVALAKGSFTLGVILGSIALLFKRCVLCSGKEQHAWGSSVGRAGDPTGQPPSPSWTTGSHRTCRWTSRGPGGAGLRGGPPLTAAPESTQKL